MKTLTPLIFAFLLLSSCNQGEQAGPVNPERLYPAPGRVALDTMEGYVLNTVRGDSIQALKNSLGNLLVTGKAIRTEGMVVVHPDLRQPERKPAGKPEVVKAYQNRSPARPPRDVHTVLPDSLTAIAWDKNSPGNPFINSTGDTVITGIAIPASYETIPCSQPKPVEALQPWRKDNAIMNIKYLDLDHGMNSSSVMSVLEDRKGNIWFGTNNGGVSLYNGKSFLHFTQESGLSQDYIRNIFEDSRGNLWFGTSYGLNRFDGKEFRRFTEKEGLTNNDISYIQEDGDGNIWFGTNGGGATRYDGENFTHFTENEGLCGNSVNRILPDSKGNLWFITWGGGVCKFDGNTFTHFDREDGLCSNFFVAAAEDREGNIWFGSPDGVSMFDGKTISNYTEEQGLKSKYVITITRDSRDNLWFGTNGYGVSKYDGESFTHYTEAEGLSSNYIRTIYEDSYGNVWIGTDGGGVSILNTRIIVSYTREEGMSHDIVFSVLEDSKGNMWFGTRGGGVNRFDGKTFTHYTTDQGLCNNYVLSVYEDRSGKLWFGSFGNGASMYDGSSFTTYSLWQGLSDYTVNCILEDHKGNTWMGTYRGGITMYDGKNVTRFTEEQGLAGNFIYSMLEDSKHNIWIGTDRGLDLYREDTLTGGQGSFTLFTEKEGLSQNSVSAIFEDSHGNLWFGTSFGLNLFDGESFLHITEKEGLVNNEIKTITEDRNRNIWVSTINGLSCIVPQMDSDSVVSFSDPLILNYHKTDGLKGVNFYHSSVIDRDNRLWLGSSKNLTMLDLNSFSIPDRKPVVHLNQVDINNRFVDFRNIENDRGAKPAFEELAAFYNYPIDPEFPYRLNHLTFHFTAIDWSAPHKILYSYMIDGVDGSWSTPSPEAKADYRNLSYGSHTFMVRAMGESQEWSDTLEYSFTILPPWYHTWLARTGYVIVAVLIVLGFVRWRTAQLKQRHKELEKQIKAATQEIREQKVEVENQRDEIEAQRDELQSQRDLVMAQKKEITDSINYAKRIQSAILPTKEFMDESLPEHFVLFKPRDIVSGDFYWIKVVKNFLIVVVADCTGHGVPGSIMSMLGVSLLNEQIGRSRFDKPGEFLDRLRSKVKETLSQEGRMNEQKDGMDLAMIIINSETKELQFAGAFNPLYVLRHKGKEKDERIEQYAILDNSEYWLYELKGDRQPIAIHSDEQKFTTHQIQLLEGDTLYMLSDGYADQIGGPSGKKFLTVNLKKIFLNIQKLSMKAQYQYLENALEEWRKDMDQVDDILVMGIRVGE